MTAPSWLTAPSRVTTPAWLTWTHLAQALAWLCIAAAVTGVAAHYVVIERQWWVVIATLAPYLMLAIALAIMLLGLTRSWVSLAVAVVVFALCLQAELPLFVGSAPAQHGRTIRMLTTNVRIGHADPAAIERLVVSHQVDVLAVEELTSLEADRLSAAGLDAALPYRFLRPRGGGAGTGLWSRFPLTQQQEHTGFGFKVVSARLDLGGGTGPLVFAAHMLAPWPQPSYGWFRDMKHLAETLHSIPRGHGIADTVILGGDLNATWDHPQFRLLLSQGYDDAIEHTGAGAVFTYPTDRSIPPVIGIDHILLRSASASAVHSVKVLNSDHRGLMADITLPA